MKTKSAKTTATKTTKAKAAPAASQDFRVYYLAKSLGLLRNRPANSRA